MLAVKIKQCWCMLTLCAVSFPLVPKLPAAEPAINWETLAKYSTEGLEISAVQIAAEDKPTMLLLYTRTNVQDQTSTNSLKIRYIVAIDHEATINDAYICLFQLGGVSSNIVVPLGGIEVDVSYSVSDFPETERWDDESLHFAFPRHYVEDEPQPELDAGRAFRIELEDSGGVILKQIETSTAATKQLESIVPKKQAQDVFKWWAEHAEGAQVNSTWKIEPDTLLDGPKKPK